MFVFFQVSIWSHYETHLKSIVFACECARANTFCLLISDPKNVDSTLSKVGTLRAQSRNRTGRVLRVGPEPEGGESTQGPDGVSGLLPPASHEEALQLVGVDLLEVVAGLRSQLEPDVLKTLGSGHAFVLQKKVNKLKSLSNQILFVLNCVM